MKAFTLIELLIAAAIIAILAAIAVPNFLEAQVRAKVSRVHADLRALAVGIEAYAVYHGKYPFGLTTTASDPFWRYRNGTYLYASGSGGWVVWSVGPDGFSWASFDWSTGGWPVVKMTIYDPTNGTISPGDIVRQGP